MLYSAYKTVICKAKREGFKDAHPEDPLAPVLKALLDKTYMNLSEVSDTVVGTVLSPSSERAINCRMAAFYAGFPETVSLRTVNRQCSSGLQVVAHVVAAYKAGFYDNGIRASLESMTMDAVRLKAPVNPRHNLVHQHINTNHLSYTLGATIIAIFHNLDPSSSLDAAVWDHCPRVVI